MAESGIELEVIEHSKREPKVTEPTGREGLQSDDVEDCEFFEACELRDLAKLESLMSESGRVNFSRVDILGRTPLMIAMEKDDLQMMDMFLRRSSKTTMDQVLLHAIDHCKEAVAIFILRHPSYRKYHKPKRDAGILDRDCPTSSFLLDTTPIVLASEKNLVSVVELLLLRGAEIVRPSPDETPTTDRLTFAQRRLNVYRGLASESYITLAYQDKDPFTEAFDLIEEVKELSKLEKCFQDEYEALAEQLGDYLMKLLSEVRDSRELDMILNKVDRISDKEFEPLARLQRAVDLKIKKFVAHPSCQMKLIELWYSGVPWLQAAKWKKRILLAAFFAFVYPFMAFFYMVAPKLKVLRMVRSPAVMFSAQAYSFLILLAALLGWTWSYIPGSTVEFNIGSHNVSHLFRKRDGRYITREYQLDDWEIIILVWTLGLLWMKCKFVYKVGLMKHLCSVYDGMDWLMITLYLTSYSLGFFIFIKCNEGLDYFHKNPQAFAELSQFTNGSLLHFYWITPDRSLWNTCDPGHLKEVLFAIANIFTISRIYHFLAINGILGPLQDSMRRMALDVLKFWVLFTVMFVAFMVGIDNLLWHYETSVRGQVATRQIGHAKVSKNFGNLTKTFRSLVWVTFGLEEIDIIDLHPYDSPITQMAIRLVLGAYMVAVGQVMLNMLIAMLNRSFMQIQDSHTAFKFARSKVYLEYIQSESPRPIPLNMIPTPATFLACCCKLLGRRDRFNVHELIHKIVQRVIPVIKRKDNGVRDFHKARAMVWTASAGLGLRSL